jgi:hypothetical protein
MCCVKERALTSYRFLEHCRCGCLLGIIQIVLDSIQLIALRANKRETFDWLKFTLEGEGERTHGYAFTDTAFARYRV